MPTVVYKGKSPEQRIADRMKNSGGDLPADHRAVHGSGPTRTFTNVHHSASNGGADRFGRDNDGEQR